MKKLFAALIALLLAIPVLAVERRATSGADWVRISDKPCAVDAVLQLVPPKFYPMLHAADVYTGGVSYTACWFQDGENAHLLFGDGDQGLLPLALFTKERDA